MYVHWQCRLSVCWPSHSKVKVLTGQQVLIRGWAQICKTKKSSQYSPVNTDMLGILIQSMRGVTEQISQTRLGVGS